MPRSSRSTMPGNSALLAESAKVSAVPRRNSTIRTTAMFTVPLMIVRTRATSTTARPRSTATTIRRRSTRSAIAPPRTPKRSTGRYWLSSAIETRNGSRVWDATSSGPAAIAIPSPTLLMTVAERRKRKLRPSRAGTTASVIRERRERTGRRIPTAGGRRMGSQTASGCRPQGRGTATRTGSIRRSAGPPGPVRGWRPCRSLPRSTRADHRSRRSRRTASRRVP